MLAPFVPLAFLALLWLCLGAIIGLIAHAAHLRPTLAFWSFRGTGGILRMAALGASGAVVGGWLGILLLGRPFATPLALWITLVGLVAICWPFSQATHSA